MSRMEGKRDGGKEGRRKDGENRGDGNENSSKRKKIKPYKQFSAQINFMFLKMDPY